MKPLRNLVPLALLLCAQLGWAAPSLEDGYDAFERGDVASAVQIWRTLAEAGDATAQLNLGQLYRQGKGVEADDEQAVKWYDMAARGGSETAKYNLLLMREEGRASHDDLRSAYAVDWLAQLPDEGHLVQIMALSDKQTLEQYSVAHLAGLSPPPRVVLTTSKGKDWYVLVWGPFDSYTQANDKLATLPAKVKKAKPWVRSVSAVQQVGKVK